MDNVYDMTPEVKPSATDINITYNKPSFYKRIMANIIDLFLFLMLFLLTFSLFSSIMQNTPAYKTRRDYINEQHLASSLYINDEGNDRIRDIVSYYNGTGNTTNQKKVALSTAIDNFIAYIGNTVDEESQKIVQDAYDEFRLDPLLNESGTPYFLEDDGVIVENTNAIEAGTISHKNYYDTVYAPFIDNYCQGYLLTMVPNIASYTRYISQTILFVDVIVTFIFSGIVIWFMIPLFFRRGYKTLGKLIYKIGVVNNQYLNISKGKFVARFAIFFFGTIVLSFFTFGVPMIISFSMMAFSKNRQSFGDYMLNLYEIETTDYKVYYSKEEILFEKLNRDTSAKDFKLPPKL